MKIHVLGCGEASDPVHPNSSVVVEQNGFRLLVDLGYSAAQKLFWAFPGADDIDAIYFTHAHPDHCFGLGPLLLRLKDRGRSKPLQIICNQDSLERLQELVRFSFWGISAEPSFVLWSTTSISSGATPLKVGPFALSFAPTCHSVTNHSVLVKGQQTLFYSGDGLITEAGEKLLMGADIAFVETFAMTESAAGDWHGYLAHSLRLVGRHPDTHFCLYHIREDHRVSVIEHVHDLTGVSVPDGGCVIYPDTSGNTEIWSVKASP